jgi:glycosyltransferase involved in cell wall biosynthesis
MKTILSVIVPVYNTEKYLIRCIDSLLNQSLKEIEIILVNDGSTDNSREICLEYKSKYPDIIKYYEQGNKGPSEARNLGIYHSNSEYITFIDSDDELINDIYNYCKEYILSRKYDIIAYGIESCFIDTGKIDVFHSPHIIELDNIFDKVYYSYFTHAHWNKIYRASIIKDNNIKFFPLNYGEDALSNHLLYYYAKNNILINLTGVRYYRRNNSLSFNIYDNNIIEKKIFGLNLLFEELNKRNIFEKNSNNFFLFSFQILFETSNTTKLKTKYKVKYLKDATKFIKKTFSNNLNELLNQLPSYYKIEFKLLDKGYFYIVALLIDILFFLNIKKVLRK